MAKLSAQLGLLEQMQARMEGFSEAAKAVLKGEFADTVAAGKASALAELVTVSDSASATALEALLGAASEAVALDSAEILPDLVARIGERDLGRAVFQVEAPPSGRSAQQVPSWLRPAASAVKPKSPSHARLVANLFDGCHLCPSLGEFVRWWRANPSFDFFLVATPDGDLVDRRGLVFAGRPRKAAGSGAGVFSRESEIRSSRASLESENDRLTALNEKALGLQRDIDAADAEAAARREAVDRASQELSVAQADERSARGTLSAVDERIAREQRQLAEIDASKSEALARRDRAQAVLTTKDADLGRLRQETVQAEGSLETRRQEVESRRNALGDVRLSRAEQLQRLETVGKELAELESRRAEAAARSAARRNEAAQNDRLIGELWQTLQSMEAYRDRTTLILTTDHGRGLGPTDWAEHEAGIPGSEQAWIAVIGPDTPATGEARGGSVLHLAQVAATVLQFQGIGPAALAAGAHPPLPGTLLPGRVAAAP